jgi:hypothetical protein
MRIQQNIADVEDVEADVSEDSMSYWAGLRAQLSDEKRICSKCRSASNRFFANLKKGAKSLQESQTAFR